MALYNYPVSFSLSEIEKLQTLNIGTDFEVNDEIEELAPLMPLMRASRKQTQQSERRKQMISLEKRK